MNDKTTINKKLNEFHDLSYKIHYNNIKGFYITPFFKNLQKRISAKIKKNFYIFKLKSIKKFFKKQNEKGGEELSDLLYLARLQTGVYREEIKEMIEHDNRPLNSERDQNEEENDILDRQEKLRSYLREKNYKGPLIVEILSNKQTISDYLQKFDKYLNLIQLNNGSLDDIIEKFGSEKKVILKLSNSKLRTDKLNNDGSIDENYAPFRQFIVLLNVEKYGYQLDQMRKIHIERGTISEKWFLEQIEEWLHHNNIGYKKEQVEKK